MISVLSVSLTVLLLVQGGRAAAVKPEQIEMTPEQLSSLPQKLEELEQLFKKQQAQVEILESVVQQQQVRLDQLKGNDPQDQVLAENGEQEVAKLEPVVLPENSTLPKQFADAGSVYFTACSDHGEEVYSEGDRIHFNVINHEYPSDIFDTSNYDFHCPVSGHYFFALTVYYLLYTDVEYKGAVQLYADSTYLMDVYGRTPGSGAMMISNSVIAYCSAGSSVYAITGIDSRIYGGGHRTSFTGFLLR